MNSYDLAGDEPRELFRSEVDALKQLCSGLPQLPIIIQIGAGPGCSTLAMLEERPDAFILSIDKRECPQERQHIEQAGLDWRRVVRVLGNSQDIGLAWPWRWYCDLLYIDGDHTRPDIDEDLLNFIPCVKANGIIALHDCYRPGTKPERVHSQVYEAIEELLGKGLHYPEVLWTERLRAFRKTSLTQ